MRAAGDAGSGACARPAAAAEPGGRGQLHPRRKPGHQCRRHAGAALGQCARTLPGAGSRHRRRAGVGRPERPAQGQYRLRPARPDDRQRRNAGHHHRGNIEAGAAAGGHDHRAGGLRRSGAMRELAEAGARATGCRLDGFRGHGPPCAGPGGAPLSGPAAAAARRTLDRAAGAERHRGSCPGARAFRGLARRGAGAERHRRRRGGREPGAVAGAVAAARIDPAGAGRGGTQRQARHLAAGVGHSRIRGQHRRAAAPSFSGRATRQFRSPR